MSSEQAKAIEAAFRYMKALPRNAGTFANLRLEEIEEGRGKGRGKWMITISYTVPMDVERPSNILAGLKLGRSYRVITVDGSTGRVLSMKIRQL